MVQPTGIREGDDDVSSAELGTVGAQVCGALHYRQERV
jgi:hypothetical protein